MVWVFAFGGIGLGGFAVLALLVRGLVKTSAALMTEVDVALGRLDDVAHLVDQIEAPTASAAAAASKVDEQDPWSAEEGSPLGGSP